MRLLVQSQERDQAGWDTIMHPHTCLAFRAKMCLRDLKDPASTWTQKHKRLQEFSVGILKQLKADFINHQSDSLQFDP